jgi:Phage Mu protein F like protein
VASRPVWQRLHRIADRAEPGVRRALLRALEQIRDEATLSAIERALRSGDQVAFARIANTLPTNLRPVVRRLEDTFRQASAFGKDVLRAEVQLTGRLDLTNPRAIQQAQKNAATLVTNVSRETRLAIRDVVTRAISEGIDVREAARMIRPLIGLTRGQATAVLNQRERLLRAGVEATRVQAISERYADKLLRYRSRMIARTEVLRASNDGLRSSWREAQRQGLLDGDTKKRWLVTPDDRLCELCAPLADHEPVLLEETFDTDLGPLQGPPLHPNCRCTLVLTLSTGRGRRSA